MLSEGIHSLVDTGMGRARGSSDHRRPPAADQSHPFGYGKGVYIFGPMLCIANFAWSLWRSIAEGVLHFPRSPPLENPLWTY